ncbi:TonB-dependent receptor [Novosphingobium sp. B 225]|uniref:TonB-dependent receptor n=1 Tax=Novosphingobium sp. B 225 TaxID=1961849 RepID=UPI000B4AE22F|nr:TonB-dependent receptor [Novosphingobium sp. B 225]
MPIHTFKAGLRGSAAAMSMALLMIAAPGFAQTADTSADGAVDEIIVTAQKREQSLSKVSLSVSAVAPEQLADTNTVGLESLQNIVPSISFGNDFNFAKLFIRGIGLSSSLPGVDPSVALHVDGAVVSLPQAQLGSMFDLERVEVLRGPQGTLYGRNATGGTVNLITAKPTDHLDGYVRQTIGGDAVLMQTDAAIGGPLADGVSARIAVQRIHRKGYGINEYTGNEIDNASQWSLRGHLQFKPSERFTALFTGELHTEDDQSLAIKFRELSFPGTTTASLTSLGQRTNLDGSKAAFASNVRNLNTNFDPINDRRQWSLTGALTYDASDAVMLKSTSSYRRFRAYFFHDFDMSSYLGYRLAQTSATQTSANHWQPVWQNQFSQDFQANFETGKLHAVTGLFYLNEHINVENHIGYDVLTNSDPWRVKFDGSMDIETWAAYANLTYDLSDQFSLKAGGRYSWEGRRYRSDTGIGAAATGFVQDPLQWDARKTWDNFSPSLGFEFRPNDAVMAYFNWSRGFKSGTAEIGSRRTSAAQVTPFVDPEKVEAFEGGVKYDGGGIQANLAVFYHRLKNAQFQRTFPIAAPPFFASRLENAAQSRAYGAELEWRWKVSPAFSLDGSVAYLDSKFTKFFSKDPLNAALFGPGGAALPDQDLSGNYTRMSPRWSVNLNPEYRVELAGGSMVKFGANFAYRAKQYHTEFNDDRLAQDGYVMLDANVKWTDSTDRYSVNLWMKNITNELIWSGSYAVATSRTVGGTLMPPRTYGVTLGIEF